MSREFSLEVEGLGKSYRMYQSPFRRILEAGTGGRVKGHHEFWALKDINFKMRPGTSLGLCGANGAGKSTLLKVLAGTTSPSEGRYRMNGRVASLLELGAGFHMDFTGRANIFMNGIMMGFSRREMAAKVDEIIEFAELGDYIDEPVRTYSSGMGLRLGFSVAVAVDPDILIIDEVFAVGDMYFQKKCVDRIYDFKRKGKTILFCSHSLYDVRQMCDDAIWLKNGNVAAIGNSVYTTNEYTSFQRDHIHEDGENPLSGEYPDISPEMLAGRKLPKVLDARMYRVGTDDEAYEVNSGDSIELRIWWQNPDPAETPINLGMGLLRQDMTTCGGHGTHLDGVKLEGTSGCTVLRMPNLRLLAGQFLVPILLMDGEGVHKYQEFLLPENLVVRNETKEVGLFRFEHEWADRSDLPVPTSKSEEAPA
ncbi:MAG: polysaccharide ABC transporter ATP-binding protein [Planctomycetota bacterium]|nr:polysaccharide ABC transporter ATP-binding protein [Planctomycetota bacterium]